MSASEDLKHCRDAIRVGSRSFHAASRLLPEHVRNPALALYAFCRLADDAVDLNNDKHEAVQALRSRLDLAYSGTPRDAHADRAFSTIVRDYEMPRALPEALLEGLAWDAEGRRYRTLSDLTSYSARVAASVGVMMTVLMGVRDRDAISRACDLGVAMQLTNIARDLGEDARAGRLYVPLDWMDEYGLEVGTFLSRPACNASSMKIVQRLLAEAERLYVRGEAGVAMLPLACRPGILAARNIYAAIGRRIEVSGFDTVTRRARTSAALKLTFLAGSLIQTAIIGAMPRSAVLHAKPLEETAFLVEAAAPFANSGEAMRAGWPGGVVSILAQLEARDRSGRGLCAERVHQAI